MDYSESLKMVKRLTQYYNSFRPDADTEDVWAQELFGHFQEHDAKWVWQRLYAAIIDEGSNFVPSLPWVLDKVYVGVKEKRLGEKYNTRQVTESREDAPQSVIKENVARVHQIVADAVKKAKGDEQAQEMDFKEMAERRIFGRVLSEKEREQRKKDQVSIRLDPEREANLLALYVQHTGNDGASKPKRTKKKKHT